MRRNIIPITALAFMLAATPALAQTAGDTVPTAQDTTQTTSTEGANDAATGDAATGAETTDVTGNFSRSIPQGLTTNLTDEELDDFQSRLDAAETPQERNTIRNELQRLNQERHLETVQGAKAKPKGFFDQMAADFNAITSGRAVKEAKEAKAKSVASGDKKDNEGGANGGKTNDRGGKDRDGRSGGGGNGGGNGGGKK